MTVVIGMLLMLNLMILGGLTHAKVNVVIANSIVVVLVQIIILVVVVVVVVVVAAAAGVVVVVVALALALAVAGVLPNKHKLRFTMKQRI